MSRSKGYNGASIGTIVSGVAVVGTISYVVWSFWRKSERRRPSKKPNNSNIRTAINAHVDETLKRTFEEATLASKSVSFSSSNGDKLMLYGLYKQATAGDAPLNKRPSIMNVVAHAKYSFWCKFRGMPAQMAMVHYIQAVKELQRGGSIAGNDDDVDYDEAAGIGSGMGLKQSLPIHEEEEEPPQDASSSSLEAQLRYGAIHNDLMKMKDAIEAGAEINGKDEHGETPLHFCADRGHLDGLLYLLELGAYHNAADMDGISVLQAAVIAGNVDIVKVLLKKGADPDQQDADGDTPRSCAEEDSSATMRHLFQNI